MATALLMGNEAAAHAALEAGVNVVAGYPGTPSSELTETVARLHAQGRARDVWVEWSVNEKAALEVVAGASLAGARGLLTCKQMGLNVASDALMSLNYLGVRGGVVLYVADDPGPISSQTEQDTRRFAAFAKVPVLDPATPEQLFTMMRQAFDLSERYGTPVVVRPTTRICHASTYFDVADATDARPVPEEGFVKDPRWVIFPARSFAAHKEIHDRLQAMAGDFATEQAWRACNPMAEFGEGTPRLGIVAGGVSAAYTREALARLESLGKAAGKTVPGLRFWQVGTPYPFPEALAARFGEGLDGVLAIEELDSVVEEALLAFVGRTHAPFDVEGRLTGAAPIRGEQSVTIAGRALATWLDRRADSEGKAEASTWADLWDAAPPLATPPLAPRPPVLCAGCPHRASFMAVKRALGREKAVLCGDIGCYTLGNAAPLDAVDTCLCMGAGITMAQGISTVEPGVKTVAFVGDSTYFASGMTGVANAAYNGHDVTIAVLDNATTAMTGLQPHPGTGVTLMGARRRPLVTEETLRALGIEAMRTVNPFDFDAAVAAAQEMIAVEGPSALICKAPCVQLHPPAPALRVDPSLCTGCRRCVDSLGCPAIDFDPAATGPASRDRGQARVLADLCNGCELCTFICPFDAFIAPALPEEDADV